MKTINILIMLFIPVHLFAQEKMPCNEIYQTDLYFKNIKFREERKCRFNKALYDLKKDSIKIVKGFKEKDAGQLSKYTKEKYANIFGKKIVIFHMIGHPQLFIAELFKDSLSVLSELKTEVSDDERNYDIKYSISSEFYLKDMDNDKQPELIVLLVDEGGNFKIKIYKFELEKNKKIIIKKVFRSGEMKNYYNGSYCEGEKCKFIDLVNEKMFIKTSPMSYMDRNEDLNLRAYEKRMLLKYNFIKKSYEIYR
jgi:hypothetical protein